MISRWSALSCCLAMLLPSPAGAAGTNPQTKPWRACIAVQAARLDFSGAILMSRKGEMLTYVQGQTRPGGSAITDRSRFNVGSASKMFTAVAVGQLLDAGKIELGSPIGGYVDGLTPQAAAVTVQQLLNHSSGLGNFFTPDNLAAITAARRLDDLKPLVAAETPAFTPGARFAYSNSGFLLLGLMIERVGGQTYGDYLAAHVFAPAGMASTSLRPIRDARLAQGMTGPPPPMSRQGTIPEQSTEDLRPAPEAVLMGTSAGGAYSTVGDLRRFFAALSTGRLLKPETARLLSTQQIVAAPARGDRPELGYGLGFGASRFEAHRWFGHNGGAPGVNAETMVFPDDDATLIVLSNRDPPMAARLLQAGREVMFTGRCEGIVTAR